MSSWRIFTRHFPNRGEMEGRERSLDETQTGLDLYVKPTDVDVPAKRQKVSLDTPDSFCALPDPFFDSSNLNSGKSREYCGTGLVFIFPLFIV
jgi:hypothetical protein